MALSLKDRKVRFGIAGGVAGLLAAFLLLKILGGGGSGTASPTSLPPITQPTGTVVPTPSPTPPTVVVFSGRDPFQNLFGGSSGSSTSTSPTSGGTSTPPPSGGTTTPPPSGGSTTPPPPSGGGGGGNGGQGGTNIGGHSVLLDDVFVAPNGVRKAQVEVDGTVYTVAAGESFDSNFKLVSFPNASCAHFVYGDEGFTLCTSGGK